MNCCDSDSIATTLTQVADLEVQLSEVSEMHRKMHSAEAARDARN